MKTLIVDDEPRIVQGARKYFCRPDPPAVLAAYAGATGLSMAHGGRIWVQSTVAQGSTFTFALPARG